MGKVYINSAAMDKAFKDFDRALVAQLSRLSKSVNAACEKVEYRIRKVIIVLYLGYNSVTGF